MLATTHPPSSSPPSPFTAFLPTHPSPLSPRSANIYAAHAPRSRVLMSTTPGQENSSNIFSKEYKSDDGSGSSKKVPFAKRAIKKAPSPPRQDELKERRRGMFLRKVKEGREERGWERRGDDIMRLDFMQRQRAWEAEQARHAPNIPSDDPAEPGDEEDVEGFSNALPMSYSSGAMQVSQPSTQQLLPEEEVEEVAQMEDRELEALLEFMPTDENGNEEMEGNNNNMTQNLWSDDDDEVYEELFSELMEQDRDQGTAAASGVRGDGGGGGGEQQEQTEQGGEAMDMS